MQNEIFNSNNVKKVFASIEADRLKAKNALDAGNAILYETLSLSVDSPFMAVYGDNAKKIQKNWDNLNIKFEEFNKIMLSLMEKLEETAENNKDLENTTNIEVLDI